MSAGLTLTAEDRVILFESSRVEGAARLPGQIQQVNVSQQGRSWSIHRRLDIPAHEINGKPVALADASRIVWLAREAPSGSTVLAQYDVATGRAAIVDVGRFDRRAFLVADPSQPRVFVVERDRVVSVNAQLQLRSIGLEGPKTIYAADVAGGRVLAQRRTSPIVDDAELVVIEPESGAIEKVFPLGHAGRVVVRADGQRFYHAYFDRSSGQRMLDLHSLATGALLARSVGPAPAWLFVVDELRGVVVYDERASGRSSLVVLTADTLAFVGEFAAGHFDSRTKFVLTQTSTDRAVVVFSREIETSAFDECSRTSPRIDVFDGVRYALVNRIDLGGRCPFVIPLPAG